MYYKDEGFLFALLPFSFSHLFVSTHDEQSIIEYYGQFISAFHHSVRPQQY